MSLTVESFTFNPFQENTYVVSDAKKNAVIIDPGCYGREESEELLSYIDKNELVVKALLNTHAHIDHVLGNHVVKASFDVPFYLHEKDIDTLNAVGNYAHLYGFQSYLLSPQPDHLLKGGEELIFGDIRFKVFFTPGHAPGHVVYYNEEYKFVINGDVLFQGSFGRVDLPGGDMDTLKRSIHEIMFQLPEETVVYTGHGPSTTIGQEKRSNYILNF